ncbi:Acg family FMN-binding oxidoreductase [Actinokineospora iranica]|uniref:Nitroreductase n=1 Tax=Actinokineospora iranica TaxID=1271860 RepID=A0A1G6JQW6_9PSEU|nr:nitroreductase family protein [Actinokineospora iranica]SDC21068.1 Nitroreductase [Actinokineospora iranica]
MGRSHPDHQTVLDAVGLACRAPSVHNTQPWRWLLGDRSVHLMADWTRQVPATDPDGRDLLVSCGAALHHLRVAFAALGWDTETVLAPNPADPDHLAAVEPHRHTPDDDEVALAAAVTRRRTDRRRYSSWPVPDGHIDLLVEHAAAHDVVAVPVTDPFDRHRLAQAIAMAAIAQEDDPAYRAELAVWAGRGRGSHEGVPAADTPRWPVTHDGIRMREFPGGTLTVAPTGETDAAQLLVLATADDSVVSRLRAGQAASAILLAATGLRLATCPLSQPLEVPESRALIQERVLGGQGVPQLVLRVGYAPTSAEPLPPSPRRPVDEVTAYLPGFAPRRPS